jgi:hypothetical protein
MEANHNEALRKEQTIKRTRERNQKEMSEFEKVIKQRP